MGGQDDSTRLAAKGLTLPCFALTSAGCPSLGRCSRACCLCPAVSCSRQGENPGARLQAARGLGQATAGILSRSGDSQGQLLAQLWKKESGYLHCPSLPFLSDSLALPSKSECKHKLYHLVTLCPWLSHFITRNLGFFI